MKRKRILTLVLAIIVVVAVSGQILYACHKGGGFGFSSLCGFSNIPSGSNQVASLTCGQNNNQSNNQSNNQNNNQSNNQNNVPGGHIPHIPGGHIPHIPGGHIPNIPDCNGQDNNQNNVPNVPGGNEQDNSQNNAPEGNIPNVPEGNDQDNTPEGNVPEGNDQGNTPEGNVPEGNDQGNTPEGNVPEGNNNNQDNTQENTNNIPEITIKETYSSGAKVTFDASQGKYWSDSKSRSESYMLANNYTWNLKWASILKKNNKVNKNLVLKYNAELGTKFEGIFGNDFKETVTIEQKKLGYVWNFSENTLVIYEKSNKDNKIMIYLDKSTLSTSSNKSGIKAKIKIKYEKLDSNDNNSQTDNNQESNNNSGGKDKIPSQPSAKPSEQPNGQPSTQPSTQPNVPDTNNDTQPNGNDNNLPKTGESDSNVLLILGSIIVISGIGLVIYRKRKSV